MHPAEKAQYPEFFARREVRKKEFIERWVKKYGNEPIKPVYGSSDWAEHDVYIIAITWFSLL